MSSLCKTRLNMDVIILQKRKKESFQMIIINHELENCIYNVLLLYCCHYFFFFSTFSNFLWNWKYVSIVLTKENQIYLCILRYRAWSYASVLIHCRSIINIIEEIISLNLGWKMAPGARNILMGKVIGLFKFSFCQ